MPDLSFTSARGFTLIEALVGVALMAMAGASLAGVSVVATRSVALGRDRTLATLAAAAALAREARADAAPTAASCLQADAAGCADGVDAEGRPAVAGDGVYRRRWHVDARAASGPPARLVIACAGAVREMGAVTRGAPGSCLVAVAVEVQP
jgi:prepilin-type N-terminal cleavage/methylation domain-containing protein